MEPDELQVRLPHIGTDETDLADDLLAHGREESLEGFDGAFLAHPQQARDAEVDLVDQGQVLVALGVLNLIDTDVDNMWALGGESIRDLHYDPPMRKKPVKRVLLKMIEYGGPLVYHGREAEQNSFDATCRKFRKFLDESAA